jgi:hypothetical protein
MQDGSRLISEQRRARVEVRDAKGTVSKATVRVKYHRLRVHPPIYAKSSHVLCRLIPYAPQAPEELLHSSTNVRWISARKSSVLISLCACAALSVRRVQSTRPQKVPATANITSADRVFDAESARGRDTNFAGILSEATIFRVALTLCHTVIACAINYA